MRGLVTLGAVLALGLLTTATAADNRRPGENKNPKSSDEVEIRQEEQHGGINVFEAVGGEEERGSPHVGTTDKPAIQLGQGLKERTYSP